VAGTRTRHAGEDSMETGMLTWGHVLPGRGPPHASASLFRDRPRKMGREQPTAYLSRIRVSAVRIHGGSPLNESPRARVSMKARTAHRTRLAWLSARQPTCHRWRVACLPATRHAEQEGYLACGQGGLQGYLAHKKLPPAQDRPRALDIGLL
jgi:hypothetical protein